MEPDTAAAAATVAAADATATIVVLEDEQPGPSTFKEEEAADAATEATTTTEKGEKKEVNRKGVCVCAVDKSSAWPLQGAQTLTFRRRQVSAELCRDGGDRCVGAAEQSSIHSPPPFFSLPGGRGWGWGAGGRGAEWRGAVILGLPSPSTVPGPLYLPGTGVTGWGMGPCRKKPPPLPLLLLALSLSLALPPPPTFPSASAWEIWALESHTRAKGVWLGLIFVIGISRCWWFGGG
jgi:hypothetical protein